MSNVKILANAFVITSAVKTADFNNLKKFHPEQLKLKDAETKNEVFAVSTGSKGSIGQFGVTFDGTNTEGYANTTQLFPESVNTSEARSNYIVDNIGGTLLKLNQFETVLAAKIGNLGTEIAAIKSNITEVE